MVFGVGLVPLCRELDRLQTGDVLDAIGVAGESRSRDPEWMSAHLPQIFTRLSELRAGVCHYKVCSTFDSSPETGSIGRAREIGQSVFAGRAATYDRAAVFPTENYRDLHRVGCVRPHRRPPEF